MLIDKKTMTHEQVAVFNITSGIIDDANIKNKEHKHINHNANGYENRDNDNIRKPLCIIE
jgi:hypothetical protein